MYSIDYRFSNNFDDIINAFTHVYGEEYKDLIEEKVFHTIILHYFTPSHLESYSISHKIKKRHEIEESFYQLSGLNNKDNKEELKVLLSYSPFSDITCVPILSFEDGINSFTDEAIEKSLLTRDELIKLFKDYKLDIINFYLKEKNKSITEDEISEFENTDEYKKILSKVNNYVSIYVKLRKKYDDYCNELKSIDDYVDSEQKRKNEIENNKLYELLSYIIEKLPLPTMKILNEKTSKERFDIVISFSGLSSTSSIEYFHSKYLDDLKNPDVDIYEKSNIVAGQSYYLKMLGIDKNNLYSKCFRIASKKDETILNEYIKEFEEKNYRQFAPSDKDIELITNIRKKLIEEYQDEYKKGRHDLNDIHDGLKKTFGMYDGFDFLIEKIDNAIDKNEVCILNQSISYVTPDRDLIVPIMIFAARNNDYGRLEYVLLHEFGHAIDKRKFECGLEPMNIHTTNPYDDKYRKYEKINEAFNDMFTRKAIDYLCNHDIFILDPKDAILEYDYDNDNSYKAVVDLLNPIYENFKEELVKAKVYDPKYLIDAIGEDNYEELNDIVNKVHNLLDKGLFKVLKNNVDHPDLEEYNNELKRAEILYEKIFSYRDSLGNTQIKK